jgi:UDP-N-acetylglucosamine--N-acetylmuramyl-(pentapeptide) pyrophosphoryl-undecaprenol N-acetylglucosamine transferase
MDIPARLSFVSYAVNGSGLGHLVRQVAIQRWLRRYCAFCGTKSAHWFLTTSEADTFLHAEGFAGFKLPSKSVVEESGIGKQGYLALAKQWVWNSLGLIRPDVLLVDTFPNGSFHELAAALDLVPKKALVLRPVKEDFARRSAYAALVGLYDRVIVPAHADDEPGLADALGLPPTRLHFTGPLFRLERFELRPRDAARRQLGIADGTRALLVSGGGGGDPGVAALFDRVERLAAPLPDLHLVFAAGPLFRGVPRRGPRRTWLAEHDLAEHLAAIDVAVCAAGFNSLHELAFAGVPTIFVPQDKVADDQQARACLLADRGAARVVALDDEPGLLAALTTLWNDDRARASMTDNARTAQPDNHARAAAATVLSLVLPRSVLRQAERVLDDRVLSLCAARGLPPGTLIDLALTLAPDTDRAALELDDAIDLLARTTAPVDVLSRTAAQLQKKVRGDELGDATAMLVTHPAVDGQWQALVMLLQALGPERVWTADALVHEIVGLVDHAAARGLDLFAVARVLSQVRSGDDDGRSSNRVALATARERIRHDADGGPPSPSSTSSSASSPTRSSTAATASTSSEEGAG